MWFEQDIRYCTEKEVDERVSTRFHASDKSLIKEVVYNVGKVSIRENEFGNYAEVKSILREIGDGRREYSVEFYANSEECVERLASKLKKILDTHCVEFEVMGEIIK